MRQFRIKIYVYGLLLISFGCIEEIDLQSEVDFESVLVIEATITNELKPQEILLSRSFPLEADGPSPEANASVRIVGDDNSINAFQEIEAGLYRSLNAFAAQPNVNYSLEVTTANGRMYGSDPKVLTAATQIDNLYAERDFNENDEEGVSIYLDTFDPTGNSKYYRFEYEETYKVIAPYYSPFELIIVNEDFPYQPQVLSGLSETEIIEFFILKQLREEQEQICYGSDRSNEIIVENSLQFDEDRLDGFRVRFISRDNYILSHRYSILVSQYVQSEEAHIFYKTLTALSDSETIFSQSQPGFLNGNVFSVSNPSENVVGFFEVSSVDRERLFFNYSDLYPGEDLPPYYIDCDVIFSPGLYVSDPLTGIIGYSPIQDAVRDGDQYWEDNLVDGELNVLSPYQMVFPPCGDCTVLGSNVIPDFWED
ncbi:MAG: DUF4249 domain-containing protein [Flavobacteriaceae bacterium]|nr:DUF4249 domain-containing protein [Flavobacteriaceae bacterium]